jgi:hypothetical protein
MTVSLTFELGLRIRRFIMLYVADVILKSVLNVGRTIVGIMSNVVNKLPPLKFTLPDTESRDYQNIGQYYELTTKHWSFIRKKRK